MRRSPWLASAAALALLLGACSSDDGENTSTAGTTDDTAAMASGEDAGGGLTLTAGMNDPDDLTIAILEFMPEDISVDVGTEVTWDITGPEPHSVTFLPEGEAIPNPVTDAERFEALQFTDMTESGLPVDGTTLVNSGLVPLGPEPVQFSATFDTEGEFSYFCVIHPLMTGTVTVVAEGGENQADLDKRAAEEEKDWLAEGRAAKAEYVAAAAETEPAAGDGGASVYTVGMGVTTEHTDILAFAAQDLEVSAGDSVTFLNESGAPHTATYSPPPPGPDFMEAGHEVAPGPSPQTVVPDEFTNTGWLLPGFPPETAAPEPLRTFTWTFEEPGTYPYVCILHIASNMVGVITVAE